GEQVRLLTHDPSAALAELFDRGIRHVLVEGGPILTAAFLRAHLVDELIVHLAPTLLGAGRPAVEDLSITTLADRLDLDLAGVTRRAHRPPPHPPPPAHRLTRKDHHVHRHHRRARHRRLAQPGHGPRSPEDPLPARPGGHRARRLDRRQRLLPDRHRGRR